jgi:hypothetical protein
MLHRVSFTATDDFVTDLTRVKETMAREFPEGDLLTIFHAGLKLLLEKQAKREARVRHPRSTAPTGSCAEAKDEPCRKPISKTLKRLSSSEAAERASTEVDSGINEPNASPLCSEEERPSSSEDVSSAMAPENTSAANDNADERSAVIPGPAYIPAAVRRAVWERDGHCCQWKLGSGGICGERKFLELDHIVPRALGGPSTVENLRVLCSVHNRLAAQQVFGAAKIERAIRERRSAGTGGAGLSRPIVPCSEVHELGVETLADGCAFVPATALGSPTVASTSDG